MSRLIGSIDQGTSSSRFILFDEHGSNVASHQLEHTQITDPSNPGWASHDPMEILRSVTTCINHVMSSNPTLPIALGITNQRETTCIWDRVTGKPLHHALVWHDTRTREIVQRLITKYGGMDAFRSKTGLPISTYFSATKLLWLMENIPEVKQAVDEGRALFGTIDTWLIWNLTGGPSGGVHITDVTNASRTLLMNIQTCTWDETILKELGIPKNILPQIKSSAEVYGHVASGPLTGIPISGCLGDQQAALVGQLCLSQGQAKNTYGTGCFMLMNTGERVVQSTHGLLTTVGFQLGPTAPTHYALEGSVAVAGSAIQWLRDRMNMISAASEIDTLAGSVPDTAGVYVVPAFSGLLSPYWREDARGVAVGLTHATTHAHFARATLEASAYQTSDVLTAMTKDSGINMSILKVDGGLCNSQVLMQFQANLLNIDVVRASNLESTAAGAAYAAGLATGIYTSPSHLITTIQSKKAATIYTPKMNNERRTELMAGWKKAVTRTFGWVETPSSSRPSLPSSTSSCCSLSRTSTLSSFRCLLRPTFFIGLSVGVGVGIIANNYLRRK